jgi:hypothetical protein
VASFYGAGVGFTADGAHSGHKSKKYQITNIKSQIILKYQISKVLNFGFGAYL